MTLVIVAVCSGLGIAIGGGDEFWQALTVERGAEISGALAVLSWLASINLLVLIFNLIPAFPLDGGRIARAIAWKLTGDRNRATRFAATLGQGFSYLFIALGLVWLVAGNVIGGIWLALIGFILAQSARGYAMQSDVLAPDRGDQGRRRDGSPSRSRSRRRPASRARSTSTSSATAGPGSRSSTAHGASAA